MPYPATVFQVMIASPGDVAEEREKARELIHQWNANHSREKGIVLLPADWTTHASPEMSDRPQEIINRQVLEDSELLVGIFWTRLGTPTGEAPSGTVEEIEKHTAAGKPAMLYFSSKPRMPDGIDQDQYSRLKEFKKEQEQKGLCCGFDSIQDFESQFRNHLHRTIINHEYFKEKMTSCEPNISLGTLLNGAKIDLGRVSDESEKRISDLAAKILKRASLRSDGKIQQVEPREGGTMIRIGLGFIIKDRSSNRKLADAISAINELESSALLSKRRTKDGYEYLLTKKGYEYADKLPNDS